MPQALKIQGAKSAVEKECEKLEKIPAWQLTKVRNKKEVIDKAGNKGRKVHLASLMDLCDLKSSELEPQFQKYKGRVVLRGDTVKDDSGSYAVFTKQGSSASQMTAAKVMDIVSSHPGCSGQPADGVSAYTQIKMEDAPTLLKIPKSECPDMWIRPPRHKWPKSWSSMEDSVVPLERNLYGHPLAGLLWERQFEKILSKSVWSSFGRTQHTNVPLRTHAHFVLTHFFTFLFFTFYFFVLFILFFTSTPCFCLALAWKRPRIPPTERKDTK